MRGVKGYPYPIRSPVSASVHSKCHNIPKNQCFGLPPSWCRPEHPHFDRIIPSVKCHNANALCRSLEAFRRRVLFWNDLCVTLDISMPWCPPCDRHKAIPGVGGILQCPSKPFRCPKTRSRRRRVSRVVLEHVCVSSSILKPNLPHAYPLVCNQSICPMRMRDFHNRVDNPCMGNSECTGCSVIDPWDSLGKTAHDLSSSVSSESRRAVRSA